MSIKYIPVVLLVVSFNAIAMDTNWTREDSYRQAAATALFIADWSQTRYFIKHPCALSSGQVCANPFYEAGPAHYFIGKHPSVGELNTFAVIGITGHAAISYMLPPEWRKVWQYVWIGYEANVVRTNYIGIRHGF
jgi:hypothetical protein